jgi:hypothetical protein
MKMRSFSASGGAGRLRRPDRVIAEAIGLLGHVELLVTRDAEAPVTGVQSKLHVVSALEMCGAKLILGVVTLRRGQRREAQRLRTVVDCLPYETRVAMLEGMRRYDRIIVGAYTDRTGGVCPMLAAHRCGGRTDFRSFARAWDRFTGAGRRARRATEREVRTLTTQLEASVWAEDQFRAETLQLGISAPPAPRRRHGPWLGPFRRWDGYRDAVRSALGRQADDADARSGEREAEREPERLEV